MNNLTDDEVCQRGDAILLGAEGDEAANALARMIEEEYARQLAAVMAKRLLHQGMVPKVERTTVTRHDSQGRVLEFTKERLR